MCLLSCPSGVRTISNVGDLSYDELFSLLNYLCCSNFNLLKTRKRGNFFAEDRFGGLPLDAGADAA
jgi:hypothetical protein